MRLFFLLLLLLLFDIYVFQAFSSIAQTWTKTNKYLLYGFYWAIPAMTLGLLLALQTGQLSRHVFFLLRAILMIAYLSKLLVAGVLIIDDIRRLFVGTFEAVAGSQGFNHGRSQFMAQLGVILGAVPFATLAYGIIRNRHRYTILRETVRIDRLPKALEGLRIVHISDIHSGSFTLKEPVRSAIDLINQQKADLVFFTGDLVNSVAAEMEQFIDVFDKIKARFGTFSVLGNHDYGDYVRWNSPEEKRQNFQLLLDTHQQMGWDLMLNENRILDIEGEKVAIIGVENYSAHPRFPQYGKLADAHQGTEGAAIKLLLSHDPSHWEDEVVKGFQDIDITFSGHTHGFQFGIEIPGWIKWSPVKYVYKQWAGLYQQGRQFLYVNRGLGYLGYPGRVGILPEITVIDLQKA
ncbi:MAG: metallophosphoesterase [Bacteroidota bacterium]